MMSRELKLALILGFAAVMVVGVLLSDHMSGARQARIEERTLQTPQLAFGAPAPEARTLPQQQPAHLAQMLPEDAPPPALAQNDPPAMTEEPPLELAMGSGAPLDASTQVASNERSSALQDFLAWSEKQGVRFEEIGGSTPLMETASRTPPPARPQQQQQRPAPSASQPSTQVAGAEVIHVVAENETLWAIAERYYGDGALYRRIEEANQGRLGKGGALYVGAKLVIPGATPAKTGATAKRAPVSAEAPKKKGEPVKPAGERFHVVKKGETLGDIAREHLGSAKRWPEIVSLNKSVIRDPDNVPAGVRIRLPEK
jgi:nucleoid-associated protein YgaU